MLFNKQMNSFPVCSTRVYIQSLVHVKQALGTADLYPQLLFFFETVSLCIEIGFKLTVLLPQLSKF